MAFSLSIWGTPKKGTDLKFDMSPRWWNKDQLMQDERLVEFDCGGYLDYYGEVSIDDMREFHERFRENATHWQEEFKALDEVLYSRENDFSNFYIKISEWESGLS